MTPPILIAFEGLDGAGKSTACESLATAARRRGIRAEVAKTPGPLSSPLAFSLRHPAAHASLLAFAIGNLEAVARLAGARIICVDRYMLSTLAHHAEAFAAQPDAVLGALRALAAPTPMLTVFLDAPAELAGKRISGRSSDHPLLVSLEEQRTRFHSLLADPRLDFLIGDSLIRDTANSDDLNSTIDEILNRLPPLY